MTTGELVLSNLSVLRGKALILSKINARFEGGQIAAVIGANGTGKSTLLTAIAGQLPYDGGIMWSGRPVSAQTAAFMPQAAEVLSQLTVLDAVLLGRFDQLGWRVSEEDIVSAHDVLTTLGLESLANRELSTLSGGQRQLVLLAQRLMRRPQLLILDEATSALDLRHQMEVLRHLRAYVQRTSALVLIAIHDINLAVRQADSFTLLADGTVLSSGSAEKVLTQENLAAAFKVNTEILIASSGHRVIVPLSGIHATAYDTGTYPGPV